MALAYQPRDETLGRYQLCAKLGRGGMAELYVGRLVGAGGFEKLVAIKRMLPHLSEDPQFVAMFKNEGRIAAQLSHPNVCQVYELGEVDDQLFMVMEFLRGLPWSDIATSVPDQPRDVLFRFVAGMFVQVCEGLHYAHTLTDVEGHAKPIVHRDVSPPNLFVTTDGVVKVLDFGVSKVLTEGTSTRTGMIKGKLPYMAPEQIRGEQIDARADIFSLGVVLWEAIAGKTLFERDSDYQIWKAVTEEDIPALPDARIDAVARRALSRDRAERQPTARVFADELRAAVAPHGAPMVASELQHQLGEWLEPSLARRSRDLAAVIGKLRGDAAEQAMTTPYLDISNVPGAISATPIEGNTLPDSPDALPTPLIGTQRAIVEATAPTGNFVPSDPSVELRQHSLVVEAPTRPTPPPQAAPNTAVRSVFAAQTQPKIPSRRPLVIATAAAIVMIAVAIVILAWPRDSGGPDAPVPVAVHDPQPEVGVVPPAHGLVVTDAGVVMIEPDAAASASLIDDAGALVVPPGSTVIVELPPRLQPEPQHRKPNVHEPRPTGFGTFTIDSAPYATIYVDGKRIGDTPVYQVKFGAGPHVVKAVRSDDARVKTFKVTIRAGHELSWGRITW